MPKAATAQEPQYELKHRITGAIILVSVAVLIIPLLLSEPGLEANTDGGQASGSDNTFRSRIVPLDIDNVNRPAGDSGANDLPLATLDNSRPALLDLTKDGGNAASEAAPALKLEPTPADKVPEQKTALIMTPQPDQDDDSKDDDSKAEATASAAQSPAPAPKPANLPAEERNQEGWVVRVGTFSKQANVDSVSSLLTNSGFKPRTTPVTTSLGDSTRVWLGPYAKRETADKISNRLKSLIGEKGYVTKSSS